MKTRTLSTPLKSKKRYKRDRTLSKLIDFPSIEVKQACEARAAIEGYNLKNWIENLINKQFEQ